MITIKSVIVNKDIHKPNGLFENYLKEVHGEHITVFKGAEYTSSEISLNNLNIKYSSFQAETAFLPSYIGGQEKRRLRRNNIRK